MTTPLSEYNATAFQIDKQNGVRRAIAVLFTSNTIAASIHLPKSRTAPTEFHDAFLREHITAKNPCRVVVVGGVEAHKVAEQLSVLKAWERYKAFVIATFDAAPPAHATKMVVDGRGQGLLFGTSDKTAQMTVGKNYEKVSSMASTTDILRRIKMAL